MEWGEALKARSVSCGMKGKISADLAEVLCCWLGHSLYQGGMHPGQSISGFLCDEDGQNGSWIYLFAFLLLDFLFPSAFCPATDSSL